MNGKQNNLKLPSKLEGALYHLNQPMRLERSQHQSLLLLASSSMKVIPYPREISQGATQMVKQPGLKEHLVQLEFCIRLDK